MQSPLAGTNRRSQFDGLGLLLTSKSESMTEIRLSLEMMRGRKEQVQGAAEAI
jgi:hypothetical protein